MTRRAGPSFILVALLLNGAACGSDDPMDASSSQAGGAPLSGTSAGSSGQSQSPAGRSGGAGMTASAGSAAAPASNNSNAGTTGGGPGGSGPSASGSGGMGAAAGSMAAAGTTAPAVDTVPTLYWLDINANRVMRSENFERGTAIVTRTGTAPDGVAVDVAGGKLYWSNMGSLLGTGGGSMQRANLDGTGVETIVPAGHAQTPKQMQVDLVNRHVYFCDREGAKVWRAGLDGSNLETIVSGHGYRELVGVALDPANGKFYFGDRIGRKIMRANMQMPAGENDGNRTDIEDLFVFDSGSMPIDLDIDHEHRKLFWTDRQLGTVQTSGLDIPSGQTASNRTDAVTLVDGLVDPIGISLDVPNNKMYFSELGGQVSEAALDGSGEKVIQTSGSATGVAIVHIPKP